jgi:DNA sulfur modification protein DndD
LILTEITLHNWQPYYGRGVNGLVIKLQGKSGEKNSIFYGQNTHGKSAIWQAIQFAMYGRVNKRKTGWEDGNYKPYIADNTGAEPLLNLPAYEENDFVFAINMKFNHDGDNYELDRSVEPRTGISKPKRDSELLPSLTIKNLTKSTYEKSPQNFLNKILPENLAQFFMFDGERLNGYRDLFEDTKSVELKSYIEHVLRLPVLTNGISDFEKILTKKQKAKSSILLSDDKNEEIKLKVAEIEKERDQWQKIVDDRTSKIEVDQEELRQVNIWLDENGTVKDAYNEFEKFDDKENGLKEQISDLNDNFQKSMPGTWRALLTNKIIQKVNEIKLKLKQQEKAGEAIGALQESIKKNQNLIDGDVCDSCGQELPKIDLASLELYSTQITEWNDKITELEKERITPNPFELMNKLSDLQEVVSDKNLQFLVDYEDNLLKLESKITTNKGLLKAAKDKLKSESLAEIKAKILKEESLTKTINKSLGKIEQDQEVVDNFNSDILSLTNSIVTTSATDSVIFKQVDKSEKILEELIKIWKEEAISHRETMRENVEKHATDVFLGISTLASEFSKVQIDETFKVDLLDLKDNPDGGSSGQSALMAYSVIDALTIASGIEFPFIVDTPSTSIDDDNLKNLFEFLLIKSKRQILILPEGKEIKPEAGDEEYGYRCARTYQIKKIPNKKKSILELRIDNC